MADRLAGTEKCAPQVYIQHLIEISDFDFVAWRWNLDARVIDQNVEGPERLEHLGEHVLDLVLSRDVRLDDHVLAGVSAGAGLPDCRLCRLGIGLDLVARIVDGNIRAFLGKADGGGLSDSGSCSGYEHVLVLKPEQSHLSVLSN
jgi:hypothetical protein